METIYEIKTIQTRLKISDVQIEQISEPEAAARIAHMIYSKLDADQEHFTILCLNKANKIRGYKTVASGAIDKAAVDPRIIFRYALLMGATALILIHNHPSGRLDPSPEDVHSTKKIAEAGRILGIKITDHLIINNLNGYRSLCESGLM